MAYTVNSDLWDWWFEGDGPSYSLAQVSARVVVVDGIDTTLLFLWQEPFGIYTHTFYFHVWLFLHNFEVSNFIYNI